MREGLRSGIARARPEAEQVSHNSVEVEEEVSGNSDSLVKDIDVEADKKSNSELVASGTVVPLQEVGEIGEGDGSEEQQCREDENLGGFKNPVLSRNTRKRSRVDEVGGGCSEKKVKKEGTDQKFQITRRILRSSSLVKREELKEADKEVSEGVSDQILSTGSAGSKTGISVGKFVDKLRCRRGRSSQVRGNDEDPHVKLPEEEVLKPKHSRPVKVEDNDKVSNVKPPEEEVLKENCGSPLEVWGNDESPDLKPPKEEMLKRKRGRPLKGQEKDEVPIVKPPKEGLLKHRRGRSCKVQGSSAVPNVKSPREELPLVEFGLEVHEMDNVEEVQTPNTEPLKEVEAPMSQEEKVKGILKRKRGRPKKIKVEGDIEEQPRDLGKCRNVKFDIVEKNGLPAKSKRRGRPPKVQISNGDLKMEHNNKEMCKGFNIGRGDAKLVRVVQRPLIKSSYLGRKSSGKQLKARRFLPAKKNTNGHFETKEDDKVLRRPRPKVVHAIVSKKHKGLKESNTELKERKAGPRSIAKQLVRDRIVDILLSAGWKIEYRRRSSKDYEDAVYVNPKGNTHWSVTLAYKKFLKQYEADQDNSNTSKISFEFTPIPEQDLSILKRIVTKTRESKKKLKQSGQSGDTSDEELTESKKHKERVSSGKDMPVRNRKRQGAQSKRRCALLARSSKDGVESDVNNYTPYDGKRTVLAWMFDLGTLPLNGKVQYMNQRRTHVKLEGKLTMDGIHCECCQKIFTISNFETHAGCKLFQPSENIYLENGSSLLQCQLDSWNKQEESERKEFHSVDVGGDDPNDDTCGICGDGGDLICCDGCPSTFHQSCLDIKTFPSGDWHCVYCSCKYCGIATMGALEGADSDIAISTLLRCGLCEEKYHRPCIRPADATPDSGSTPFCGKSCQELSERLQMLIGVKHDLEEGFSWTLVRRSDIESDISRSGVYQKIECNSKLAVALSVMNECFLPIIDHRSGVNLIRNILYNSGSNFNRLNYSGFITAVLEKNDEIVSAASIRIHGNRLAEMPFIGTRYLYRRQGMCRRLLTAIESALHSLHVENLVIPAISELKQTWTSVFGFKPLESSSRQKMRNINMMVFPGVEMLQKPILKQHEETIPSAGLEFTDPGKEQPVVNDLQSNSDKRSSESDSHLCTGSEPPAMDKINNEFPAVEPTCETANVVKQPSESEPVILSEYIERESKSTVNSPSYLHDVDSKPIEVAGEYLSDGADCHVHAPDMKTVEVDTQPNCHSIYKEDAESVPCELPKCNTENTLISDGVSLDQPAEDHVTGGSCCIITEVTTAACGDWKEVQRDGGSEDNKEAANGDTDLKESPKLQTCINVNSDSVQPLGNATSSEQQEPESPTMQKNGTLENSETLCTSSPGSGISRICASGGTPPEVMALSNQAS